jgi:hypothetical protein
MYKENLDADCVLAETPAELKRRQSFYYSITLSHRPEEICTGSAAREAQAGKLLSDKSGVRGVGTATPSTSLREKGATFK